MFSIKTIRVHIQLHEGQFAGSGNTITIEGLPISATISKQGGEEKNKATVEIYNLKLETVRQLTSLAFKRLQTYNNVIQIDVGNKGANLSTVFIGEVSSSIPVIDDSGHLILHVEAISGYYPSLLPTTPTSVQGETTIESLMEQFADEADYQFENKGVTGSVTNCVFIGSPVTKAQALARQADIDLLIDDKKFTIQPFDAPKDGYIPVIADYTGMIGYPAFSNDGISCRCVFNDKLKVGSFFKLESILPHATGEWQITKLEHHLEANVPNGGQWESVVTGVLPGSDTSGNKSKSDSKSKSSTK